MNIDLHTMAIALSITNLLQFIALFVQYQLNKNQRGPGWWVMGNGMLIFAFIFNYLRDAPAIGSIAIVASNVFFVSSAVFFYVGILAFFDKHDSFRWLIGFYAVFIFISTYFTYINNNIIIRSLNLCAALAILSFLLTRSLLIYRTLPVRSSAFFLMTVFLFNGFFFSFRGVILLWGAKVGLFVPTLELSVTYLISLISSTLWTFGFIIMVNQRLNSEIFQDKENLELIFNTSPDAVLITRLSDGYFVAVNDGFTILSGYTRSEVIGKSIMDVHIWQNSAEREKVVTELKEKGFCENMEIIFRCKDGRQIIGMVSARIITLEGLPHIISVTRDITHRKQIETEREQLITELQNALEQIKTLKGIVPICSSCKKIRDDKGYWEQVESYVSKHTEAQFTHGICPDCIKTLFPDFAKHLEENNSPESVI